MLARVLVNGAECADLRRLGVLAYLPTLDLICSRCEEVDQLNGSEACGDDLVYGALCTNLFAVLVPLVLRHVY